MRWSVGVCYRGGDRFLERTVGACKKLLHFQNLSFSLRGERGGEKPFEACRRARGPRVRRSGGLIRLYYGDRKGLRRQKYVGLENLRKRKKGGADRF